MALARGVNDAANASALTNPSQAADTTATGSIGFKIQGLRSKVWDLGYRVQGLGFRV